MAKLSYLGLGVMGAPMARHLITRGQHEVTVYNRTGAKATAFAAQYGAKVAATPREAAAGADIVLACVGNDHDLRQVTLGPQGAFAGMAPGTMFIDHTTASAEVARELFAAGAAKGIEFVDAPVSGGQAGAEAGALTIMCGGTPAAYARAEPIMGTYAKACRLMGPSGAGQLTKMVNQICIAGLVQGLAEGIAFAQKAGLDPLEVVAAISKGAAQSWQMENRHNTMAEGKFDFGFAVEWMRKDLRICLETARQTGAQLPVTALVDQFYARIEQAGGQRLDTSSLITLLG
ncbi:MAG: NAD(P)-dependent oxidoreductase [Hyphomicrobiales bacterium]|nr:NAD(P)-dependent oxidoreductase [Hyphomicrobiales bacterium]